MEQHLSKKLAQYAGIIWERHGFVKYLISKNYAFLPIFSQKFQGMASIALGNGQGAFRYPFLPYARFPLFLMSKTIGSFVKNDSTKPLPLWKE
jgi:hypothetical protein